MFNYNIYLMYIYLYYSCISVNTIYAWLASIINIYACVSIYQN